MDRRPLDGFMSMYDVRVIYYKFSSLQFFFFKEKFNNQYISRSSGLVSLGIYHLFSELEMDAEKVS